MVLDRDAIVNYWLDTAERDWTTLEHLFQSGDYHWGLFIGHLVLEKTFKALYVKKIGETTPRIHDLTLLAQKCGLEMGEGIMDALDLITRFNLNVRYPDYHQEMYRLCNEKFSREALVKIKEVRSWLLDQIANS